MSSTTRKTVPKVPKTPIRGRKDQRQPLTPSLSAALGQLQLSNNNGGRTTPPAKSGTLGSKDADTSINPFLETSVPVGQSLKTTAIFGTSSRAPGSRPGSRAGSRPGSRAGSRPGSPNKRSKSASGTKNTVNLYGMETKLDVIDISEWPSNKKEKESSSKDPTPRKRSKSQTGAVSVLNWTIYESHLTYYTAPTFDDRRIWGSIFYGTQPACQRSQHDPASIRFPRQLSCSFVEACLSS